MRWLDRYECQQPGNYSVEQLMKDRAQGKCVEDK